MNRQRRKEFLRSMHVKGKVSVLMPAEVKPMYKEWNIGRNDPCQCQENTDKIKAFEEWRDKVALGLISTEEICPTFKFKKYKNCCLKSEKYEQYQRI